MIDPNSTAPLYGPARDGVDGLTTDSDDPPTIVSISDIHGYLYDARSALLTLEDHSEFDPIVTKGPTGTLQWVGGDEYVLVVNGDLFDRGLHNEEVAEMVTRLQSQAPDGHVRTTLGNHEMGIMMADYFNWEDWYSVTRDETERRAFLECIRNGLVVAAYRGHRVTYAHAGLAEPYDVTELNDNLVAAAERLDENFEDGAEIQAELVETYPTVLGLDGQTGRGPDAGIVWLDFEHMPEDAPPQVVGHTKQDNPRRRGGVVCQNTIRNNSLSEGGEAIVVETPDRLLAVGRSADGGVQTHEFSLPEQVPPQA